MTGGLGARVTPDFDKDFLIEVAKGNVPGHSLIHKFGRNTAVGTTMVPISLGGIYRTPQVAAATTLRVKAGNVNDDASGTGAREVSLEFINTSGVKVTETLATAGTSASSATSVSAIRLYRFYVSKSGTYATQSAGSHAADIVIENSAGGTDWGTIDVTDFPRGQSEIGVYTIETGYTGYLLSATAFTDSSKTTQLIFFHRAKILETAAPYSGTMREIVNMTTDSAKVSLEPKSPVDGVFTGPVDLGIMGKVSATTSEVNVDFELLLVQDGY